MTAQTVQDTRPASSAQIKFINDLLAEGQRLENMLAASQNRVAVVADYHISPSMRGAHAQITSLKTVVAAKRAQCRNLPTPVVPVAPSIKRCKGCGRKAQVLINGYGRGCAAKH